MGSVDYLPVEGSMSLYTFVDQTVWRSELPSLPYSDSFGGRYLFIIHCYIEETMIEMEVT
jgi:hypothetical protein